MSLTILGESLSPSQQHQVKVRSVVVPGEGTRYGGTPSEWSDPVDWTSHAGTAYDFTFLRRPDSVVLSLMATASWSLMTAMYVFIGAFVVAAFLTAYCTVPACQR